MVLILKYFTLINYEFWAICENMLKELIDLKRKDCNKLPDVDNPGAI